MTRQDDLTGVAQNVGSILRSHGLKLVTVESCTGGWIAQSITSVSGSSEWFECGLVTYSNEAKHEQVGVPEALIAERGAVSAPVARAMARGGLDRSLADVALSVTGIAGPGGGSEEKPVGTVFICWAARPDRVRTEQFLFDGDREAVRRQSVLEALGGLARFLREEAG